MLLGEHLHIAPSMASGIGRMTGQSQSGLDPPSREAHSQMESAVEITRKLVDNYMSLVQSNVSDMVPKAIMHHLVHRSSKGLQQHLIGTLYK